MCGLRYGKRLLSPLPDIELRPPGKSSPVAHAACLSFCSPTPVLGVGGCTRLTTEQFDSYALRLALSTAAASYITDTRHSAPARAVGSTGRNNTVWRYPSHKMGFVVALESSEEHIYAAQLEYRPDVLEYWDQPARVSLDALDRRGGRRKVTYVPDFLVLGEKGPELIQIKTALDCERLAEANPNRWSWDGQSAADAAANQYFEAMGLRHRVVSDGQDRKVFAENCLLRLRLKNIPPSAIETQRLLQAVRAIELNQVLTLAKLLSDAGVVQASDGVRLIDQGLLYTDVYRCRLSTPEQCLVSRTDGAVSAHLDRLQLIEAQSCCPVQLTAAEAEAVDERLQIVRDNVATHRSARTRRRWRAALRKQGSAPEALRPRHREKGNRHRRFSEAELALARTSLRDHYLIPDAVSMQAAYAQYLVDHEQAVTEGALLKVSSPISNKTFNKLCSELPAEEVQASRSGSRSASAHATPVAPSLAHLQPARAFERAHTDHYLCDLHVVVIDTSPPVTRKPWITALRDEATGQLLAISLSFSSPSRHGVMGVIRDCARRWDRLPETIIADNGAEFHSTYFETTLASLGISKQSRPPATPRSGGHIETWFRTLKSYLAKQPGNTNNDARGRLANSSHKGSRRTTWTLAGAYASIDQYIFGIYNHSLGAHPLLSRSAAAERLLTAFPESGVPVQYSPALLARTALPLPRPLKLDRARGVRHSGRWYRHPSLFRKGVAERLEAYLEPWDVNVLYVLIDGKRVACLHGSPHATDLTVDFTPALDSIRFLGSARGRALLAQADAVEVAKMTRKMSTRAPKPPAGARPPASSDVRRSLPPSKDNIEPYNSEGTP